MADTEYISKEAALACFSDWIDRYGHEHSADEMVEYQRIEELPEEDVRPVVRAHWNLVGKQMVINLANAREQYSELGYPHRNILQMQCDKCRLTTMVDESIRYDYCPHCGAEMREVKADDPNSSNPREVS